MQAGPLQGNGRGLETCTQHSSRILKHEAASLLGTESFPLLRFSEAPSAMVNLVQAVAVTSGRAKGTSVRHRVAGNATAMLLAYSMGCSYAS